MALYDNDKTKDLKHQNELEKEKVTGASRREANALKWALEGTAGTSRRVDKDKIKATFAQKEKEARTKYRLDENINPLSHDDMDKDFDGNTVPVIQPSSSSSVSRFNQAVSSLGDIDSVADRVIDVSNVIMFDGRRPSKDPHEMPPIDNFPSKGRNVDLDADFDGDLPKKDNDDKGLGE